jgi:hypothetical protein
MIESAKDKISGPATAEAALRDHFLGWQCRIRQYAVRHGGGRPSSGMRPSVSLWEPVPPPGAQDSRPGGAP